MSEAAKTSADQKAAALRQRAEQALSRLNASRSLPEKTDLADLIQELTIHQIELEMQGEELRRSSADLAKTRALYFRNFESAPVPIFVFNKQGAVIEMNLAASDLVGKPRHSLKDKPRHLFEPVLDSAGARHFQSFIQQVADGPSQSSTEFQCRLPDGKTRIFSIKGVPHQLEPGTPPQILAFFQDITDLRETSKQNEFLSLVARNTDNTVIITDRDRRIVWVNEAFTRLTGYTLTEVHGKNPSILQGRETDPATVLRMRRALDAAEPFTEEILNYTKDGHPYWLKLNVVPTRDARGNLTGFVSVETDITELRRYQRELARLKIAVEQSANSIVITDRSGAIEYVNPAFTANTGYTEEEALGKNPRILKGGTHPPQFYKELWQTISSGKTWNGILCNRKKSGEIYWEDATITPVRDEKGQIDRFIAVKSNITSEKLAQERLQEVLKSLRTTEAFLEQTSHLAKVGGWSYDLSSEKLEWTKVTHEIHEVPKGYQPSVHEGILFYEEGESRERIRSAFTKLLETGEPFDIECALITAKNRRIWVRAIGHAEMQDGRAGRIYGTFQDITEHKKMRDDLAAAFAEKARQMRFITELTNALPIAVYCMDAQARFILANPAFCSMHNLRTDQILGKISTEVFTHADYRRVYEEDLRLLREGGRIESCEWILHSNDGSEIPTIMSKSVFYDEKGGVAGIVGALTDITQLKKLTAELETAREQAEAANRAKSAFLATMSHEIRTPLNAVIGMASLLEESDLDSKQKEYAHTIVGASETLLELISDILDYSKIESRKLELHVEPFILEDLVLEPVEWFSKEAEAKGIEIAHFLDPGLPVACRGDRLRLKQILINLLSNAIKFTSKGHVHLEVRKAPSSSNPVRILITVRDTGIGISPEAIERLFQPFSQADSSITRRFGGSGLGLAISKQLIRLMGGDIQINSIPGKGSEFTFDLFLEPAEVPTESKKTARSFEGRKVLVVDDVGTNRMLLSAFAKKWGMEAVEACSTHEATRILGEDSKFDVLLLDYHMPDTDGATFAASLMTNPALAGIPRILLSSVQNAEFPEGLFHAQMLKPLRPTQLHTLLCGILLADSTPDNKPVLETGPLPAIRVLVAEDNPNNQLVLRMMLRRLGSDPVIVENGALALEKAENAEFDLVILDVQMPVMDGITAVGKLREYYSGSPKRPKIIALTANAMTEDRQTCLDAGFDDYLAKPITISQLRSALIPAP